MNSAYEPVDSKFPVAITILLLFLGVERAAFGGQTKLSASVPGQALVTTGDFAGPPDAGGGFTIGIRADALPVMASHCRNYVISVDMPGTRPNPKDNQFTQKQEAIIQRKQRLYAKFL